MTDPFEGLTLEHDESASDPDCVLGPNPAARTSALLTVRPQTDLALDLGTGCGLQGLLAARHARRVVATDVNPRALEYARANAAANAVDNVEFRQGSWFEPVAGERFGLIMANPPFVISPDSEFVYRDAGMRGDQVCRMVVAGAAEHLEEDGFACVLGNWAHAAGDLAGPPLDWEAEGCDLMVLAYSSQSPREYAQMWNLSLALAGDDEYEAAVKRWTQYHGELGISAIAFGMVILRRRSGGTNWRAGFEIDEPPTGLASDQLLRMFAAQDAPLAADDRVRPAPGMHVRQTVEWRDRWRAAPARLSVEPGSGAVVKIPVSLLPVLYKLDGSTPVGDRVEDFRAAFEVGILTV